MTWPNSCFHSFLAKPRQPGYFILESTNSGSVTAPSGAHEITFFPPFRAFESLNPSDEQEDDTVAAGRAADIPFSDVNKNSLVGEDKNDGFIGGQDACVFTADDDTA